MLTIEMIDPTIVACLTSRLDHFDLVRIRSGDGLTLGRANSRVIDILSWRIPLNDIDKAHRWIIND